MINTINDNMRHYCFDIASLLDLHLGARKTFENLTTVVSGPALSMEKQTHSARYYCPEGANMKINHTIKF